MMLSKVKRFTRHVLLDLLFLANKICRKKRWYFPFDKFGRNLVISLDINMSTLIKNVIVKIKTMFLICEE